MRYTLLSLSILFVFSSCQVNTIEPFQNNRSQRPSLQFFAETEQAMKHDTKVYSDNNLRVLWNKNDQITIFDKYTYGYPYRFLGNDGDNAGSFQIVSNENFVTGNSLEYTYAVYPYSESIRISNDGILTLTLPSKQTYRRDSFGPAANTMVSATTTNQLSFKNVCGYLSIKLYGEGVSVRRITLRGNNNECLAGTTDVTMDIEGTPTATIKDKTKIIQLNCSEPVQLSNSNTEYVEFWFVVPPCTFSKGFTITVEDSSGEVFEKALSRSIEIKRNTITRMAPLKVAIPQYEWLPLGHFTFKEGWWGETHTANIKYYEIEGVRTCVAECDEGKGIWGDNVNATIKFIWYTNITNSDNNQIVHLPKQYFGYDYSDWNSKPEEEATYPVYLYDYYSYWTERGEEFDSFIDYFNKHGDITETYPVSYYDGRGGFFFNAKYYIPGLGGFSTAPFELVAQIDNYVELDYKLSVLVGEEVSGQISITFNFSNPPATVRYAIFEGTLKEGAIAYRSESIAEGKESTSIDLTEPGVVYFTPNEPGPYTLVAITLNEKGLKKEVVSCYFNYGSPN